jgi:hypothetical protein
VVKGCWGINIDTSMVLDLSWMESVETGWKRSQIGMEGRQGADVLATAVVMMKYADRQPLTSTDFCRSGQEMVDGFGDSLLRSLGNKVKQNKNSWFLLLVKRRHPKVVDPSKNNSAVDSHQIAAGDYLMICVGRLG